MSTIYSSAGLRDYNVDSVLDRLLEKVDIKGKQVLLKINMVDPAIYTACSNPARVQMAVDVLHKHRAGKIFIADQPAHYVHELAKRKGSALDIHQAYKARGYDAITKAELLDLAQLPLTSYRAIRIDPITAEEQELKIPVRDTSGMAVISFTLPKHHGNYNYSGVVKNLMGLVPEHERVDRFHHSFMKVAQQELARENKPQVQPDEVVDKILDLTLDFIDLYLEQHPKDAGDIGGSFVRRAHQHCLDQKISLDAFICQLEHVVNAGSLVGLFRHFQHTIEPTLYVLDGSYLLAEHEHDGVQKEMNFALASLDGAVVDAVAMDRLGLDLTEAPYIVESSNDIGELNIEGRLPSQFDQISLLDRRLFKDRHGLNFLRVVPQ